jgi:phage repressor protein C with HTH and peptisase S24 domain
MAKEVGTSRQNIENLELKGNRKPHYIIDLARVIGTTVDAMLTGQPAKTSEGFQDFKPNQPLVGDLIAPVAINLVNNPDFPAIRRVNIKLSAGASGFGIDYIEDDEAPIVFQRKWFARNGYTPAKLLAVRVANGSMEPGLYDGDTVVINTADDTPKDGEVFAMNYEGEMVIKRLVRDAGQWWLASDNPDKRRYPRKVCGEGVYCLGRVVHKQSERI